MEARNLLAEARQLLAVCTDEAEAREILPFLARIDAYLAKLTSTKAEPSRIAEIRAWNDGVFGNDFDPDGPTLGDHHVRFLLSHITAIEAEKQELALTALSLQGEADTLSARIKGLEEEVAEVKADELGWARVCEERRIENATLQSAKDRLTKALDEAFDFIDSLTAEPLLDANDCEMSVEDVSAHARIERDRIKRNLGVLSPPPASQSAGNR